MNMSKEDWIWKAFETDLSGKKAKTQHRSKMRLYKSPRKTVKPVDKLKKYTLHSPDNRDDFIIEGKSKDTDQA